MLLRPPERGAFWQGASGGAEDDEDIVAAARREMLEETGLAPQTIEKVDFSYSFPLADEWRHLFLPGTRTITEYVFLAKVDEGEEPVLSNEHESYRWCEFEEALGLLHWPDNVEALKRCHEVILG